MDMNITIQYTKSCLKCQEAGECDSRKKITQKQESQK